MYIPEFSYLFIFILLYIFSSQVQTNFEFNGSTQFLITIPDADNINHIVVFLTGATLFPDGMAGLGKFFIFANLSLPTRTKKASLCYCGVMLVDEP